MRIEKNTLWILVLLVSAVLVVSACNSASNSTNNGTRKQSSDPTFDAESETVKDAAPARVWTTEDVFGVWKIDFDASWERSKDVYMTDTLRGEDAYPKDQAKKAEIVRKEMSDAMSTLQYEFKPDNSYTISIDGESGEGKWEPVESDSNALVWTMQIGFGPKNTFRFDFVDARTLHMTDTATSFGGGSSIVLIRQ